MTQTNHGSDPNKIIWTQSSRGRGRGEQTNSGSDQASEPSVKAPLNTALLRITHGEKMESKGNRKNSEDSRFAIMHSHNEIKCYFI